MPERRATALLTLAIDAATAEVVEAMRRHRVEPLLLRGPAFASLLYEDGELRPYTDVDLLVAEADVAAAEAALRATGRQPRYEWGDHDEVEEHGRPWELPEQEVAIDLHDTLAGAKAESRVVYEALRTDARELVVGGTRVLAPSAAAVALLAALHASWHGRAGQAGEDLRRAAERLPAPTWAEAADLAVRVDATAGMRLGLAGSPEGERRLRPLDLPDAEIAPSERVLAAGITGSPYALARLGELRGRERLAYLMRKLAPTPGAMRRRYPIARSGRAGLALAYCARLGARALVAPAAVLAYLRARGPRGS